MIVLLAACAPPAPPRADSVPVEQADTAADPPPEIADVVVSVHPEVATILRVSWNQLEPADAWVSWELDGELYSSPVRSRVAGVTQELVLGLPADTAIPVTVHAAHPGATQTSTLTTTITTGPLPADLPAPTLTLDTAAADPSPFLLTSVNAGSPNFFGPCYTVILDRKGRIVWYRLTTDNRLTLFPRVARAGTHLFWDATAYYVSGVPSITRATLSLDQVEVVEPPGLGFTWDELPDGRIIYDEAETPYAYHLTRLEPDGSTTRLWSCADWMAPFSTDYWACAANTVLWDDATGTVLWSMFQTATIVAIEPDTGTLAWELGEYPGGLAFLPADIRLELQHYPNPTDEGTLLLTTHSPDVTEQRVRELVIRDGTAAQVWDYAAEGYYGDYAGEATRLPNGNTLVNYGTDGVLREVTLDRSVAWELDWNDHLIGHVTPVGDLYALDEGW